MKATIDDLPIAESYADYAERATDETFGGSFREIEKVFKAMQPGAVFGPPVASGQYTVITASELAGGGGFGMAGSIVPGSKPHPAEGEASAKRARVLASGWGGGGGGGASGRPVALIIIGPEGVKVEPIVDVTRIMTTCITFWGRIMPSLLKIGKHSR